MKGIIPKAREVWKHRETGVEYTIVTIGNTTCDREDFPLTVAYTSNVTGYLFMQPVDVFVNRCFKI